MLAHPDSDEPGIMPTPERARVSHPPMTVLVVDDEPDQGELLCTHLRRAGCLADRVDSAEQALARPASPTPDLVVVDLLLPGLDGWGLVRALHHRWPGTAVAVCSVLDRQEYPATALALPKPFTGPALRALLEEVARSRGVGRRPWTGLRAEAAAP